VAVNPFTQRAFDSALDVTAPHVACRLREAIEALPLRSKVRVKDIRFTDMVERPERRAMSVRVVIDLDVEPHFA
jgi:hypothetical protein